MERGEGVRAAVERPLGRDLALLGVEQEDQAKQDREEAAIDVLREHPAEELALGSLVRRVEAPEQLVEGEEGLLGELLGDLVLELAGGFEEGEEARARIALEEAGWVQEHAQGSEDGAARGFQHGLEGEGEVTGGLAAWGVDQAQVGSVGEEADGDLALPQQALEADLGAGFPGALVEARVRAIEGGAGEEGLDQEEPGTGLVRVGDREGGGEAILEFGENDGQLVGEGRAARGAGQVAWFPAEDFPGEGREVGDMDAVGEIAVAIRLEGTLQEGAEGALEGRGVLVEDDLRREEGGRGDDHADGLDEAEPCFVRFEGEIASHQVRDSGQR